MAAPGNGGPWEWRPLGVVDPGSGGPWEWRPVTILDASGFCNRLYSIFACLAISSISARRALSKLKIFKNRLRSTLADD